MKDLEGYTIGAVDGVIGDVKDFYFDDAAWVIRYLVVETGNWLARRRVLISPISINEPNWSEKVFPAAITQEQVKNSPSIDTDKPVSRQHEMAYLDYYGYPYYWGGGDFWGDGMWLPWGEKSEGAALKIRAANAEKRRANAGGNSEAREHGDPNLRSGNEIVSYEVLASDGDIGHVHGLLVDERCWAIRYIIVKTSNWWFGHQVLIAPQWITGVRWDDKKVSLSLTRDAVKRSPPYSPGRRVGRKEEARLYDHYDKPGYWAREVQLENPEFHTIP
jgi:hypothetical protein